MRTSRLREPGRRAERGIVLVISLILIVVISLLAATSMRSAASSESVSGNVRTTELATQAAEIALRHCESSAVKVVRVLCGDTTSAEATYPTTLVDANILKTAGANQWQSTATWDSASTTTFVVVPSSLVGDTATFKRPPECMVESLTGTAPLVCTPASFIITARGFGPEVPATAGVRPVGTVVWLQSTLDVQ